MSAQRTQPASGRGVSKFYINRIIKLPNHYKLKCTFTRWYMYVLDMNMPERLRECQYGWSKSANMKTFKCDGDLVLYRSSRLTRSPESDPNARGRVRGDSSALYSNEESSHILAGTNCDATEPSC